MLQTTLATRFIPGTNVKGQVTGANWSYLLPALDLNEVVCLGAPPASTLVTLARIGHRVTVICKNSRQLQEMDQRVHSLRLANVLVKAGRLELILPQLNGAVDLVVLFDWKTTRRIYGDPKLQQIATQMLTAHGLLYFEFTGLQDRFSGRRLIQQLKQGGQDLEIFLLSPLLGEMQTAVQATDRFTSRYIDRNQLYSPTFTLPGIKKLEPFARKHRQLNSYIQRYGVFTRPAGEMSQATPPRYLRAIALQSGVDISGCRSALLARGRFNTRKVLFYLFPEQDEKPRYIVKIVRDPVMNYRLLNERRALTLLQECDLDNLEGFPRPVFWGQHAGLSVLGETVVEGIPFGKGSARMLNPPFGMQAVDWLTNLGAATVQRGRVTAGEAAQGLQQLFDQFATLYPVEKAHLRFLEGQIDKVRAFSGRFPLVFQHGDPGTWNALITPEGKVAFLDWEAAEPQGMPLWDLFYFLRSYSMGSAGRRGITGRLQVFQRQFMETSPLSVMIVRSVEGYCQRIGLAQELVEPLFYTCWMHRALKQATLLPVRKLNGGHYFNLLRLTIDQRDSATLKRMFQAG